RTISKTDLREFAEQLAELSALVPANSELAAKEDEFCNQWRWGTPTALMHFCLADPDFMTIEDAERAQRASKIPQPELFLRNCGPVIQLPKALPGNSILNLMARRRTNRTASKPSIKLKD